MADLAGEQIVAQSIQIDFHDGPKIIPFGGMPATSHVLLAVHPGEPGVLAFDITASRPFVAERASLVDLASLLRAAADMVEDQGRRLV